MNNLLKTILYLLVVVLLTVLTQIGGVVFLLSWGFYKWLSRKLPRRMEPLFLIKVSIFLFFYLMATFAIVPLLAKPFGRVRMPLLLTNHVKPVTIWTCMLNRNYVRPDLKKAVESVAQKMNERYPGTELRYLDANHPFIDGFPLLPHLSHNDGRKLDLAFYYLDRNSGLPTNQQASFSGYGVFEGPRPNEVNTTRTCLEKGYWQYDYTRYMALGASPEKYTFDPERTRTMIRACIDEPGIEKMFLEPHLTSRLGFERHEKVRFHGCQAVRHDDHLHIQLKK